MLMQVAPCIARPRNPENPIQNMTMVPRATTTARVALDHRWFKAAHSSSLIKPRITIASPKATVNQTLLLLGIPFVNAS